MPRTEAWFARQFDAFEPGGDPAVAQLLAALRARYGADLAAVLLYGSWLRGKRDTLLDFYVLLDRYRGPGMPWWQAALNRLLPPNVYYLCVAQAAQERVHAKYATVRLDHFAALLRGDFHSYFWARFAQPCAIAYARDAAVRARLAAACAQAARTLFERVRPLLPAQASAGGLWTRALELTYGCELRSERTGKAAELVPASRAHFEQLSAALAQDTGAMQPGADGRYRIDPCGAPQRLRARLAWLARRWYGKLLSVARLLKATLTFNDALDYALWKIERHSGVYFEPTQRQRRHPLLFAWPLLWRIWRAGGFR